MKARYVNIFLATMLALVTEVTVADADLLLSKSVDPARPALGNPVEFEITVRNNGPDPAANIEVFDRLPSGLAIPVGMAAFTSQGAYDNDTGEWQLGSLKVNDVATLTIPATVEQAAGPSCVNNHADIVRSSADDPQPDNNFASAAVYIGGATVCSELTLTVMPDIVGGPDCGGVAAGDELVFDVEVYNAGPHAAEDVQLQLDGQHGRLANVSPDDTLNFDRIEPRSTARGSMSWRFYCGQGASVISYEVTVEAGTPLATNSIATASGELQFPQTGTCDCTVEGPGCFIATAAYGSPLHPHVGTLRRFRDEYLVSSQFGRDLVALYYRHSPMVADIIKDHEPIRLLAIALLAPIVYAVAYPLVATILLLVAIGLIGVKIAKVARVV